MKIEKKISRIKNVKGNYYNAIVFSVFEFVLNPILRKYLFSLRFRYIWNCLKRNHFTFHITVPIKNVNNIIISDISIKGLGSVSNSVSTTWYLIVDSEQLTAIYQEQNKNKKVIEPYDYHITLAFINGDVHKSIGSETIRKDISTLVL
jgi:hypothetical protein